MSVRVPTFKTTEAEPVNPQLEIAQRACQVVTKIASTLAGRKVTANISQSAIAPAWSTSKTISFSEPFLPDLKTTKGALTLNGLTYHEVAHILFSPRTSHPVTQHCQTRGQQVRSAFNILEDARIESLMFAKYRAGVQSWFTATVLQYILEGDITRAHFLVYGRKYLPLAVRKAVREAYYDQSKVIEIAQLIDSYRKLVLDSPNSNQQAIDIIERFAQLLPPLPPKPTGGTPNPEGGCQGGDGTPSDRLDADPDSKPMSPTKVRKLSNQLDDATELDDPADWGNPSTNPSTESEDDEAESPLGSGEPDVSEPVDFDTDTDGDGEPVDGEPTDGDGEPVDGKSTDGDSTSTSTSTNDSVDSTPAGGSSLDSSDSKTEAVKDSLQSALDSVLEQLAEDIANTIRTISGEPELQGSGAREPQRGHFTNKTPDSETLRTSVIFGNELKRIKSALDPSFEVETKTGRLNINRVLRNETTKRPFDKWTLGREDATEIETVILLDYSGSMSGTPADLAYRAMFGIKNALDKLPSTNTTVVLFDEDARVLYRANEKTDGSIRDGGTAGGTDPHLALKYAQQVLAESDKPVKILFTITDGQWSNQERSEEVINHLRQRGVLTALAYIGHENGMEAHSSELVTSVRNPSDLLVLGRKLVNLAIARNLSR